MPGEILRPETVFLLGAVALGGVAGLALLLWRRASAQQPWQWLAGFAALSAAEFGLETTAEILDDRLALSIARLVLLAAAGAALVEFGRPAVRLPGGKSLGPWLTGALAALATGGFFLGRLDGMFWACRVLLVLPGGALAAWSLWQASRAAHAWPRRELVGMAGSLALLAVFAAAAWPGPQTLCAAALLAALFVHQLDHRHDGSPHCELRRLALPLALALVAAGSAGALEWRGHRLDALRAAAERLSDADSGAGDEEPSDPLNDANKAAWRKLSAGRQKHLLPVLAVGGVLVAGWFAAAHFCHRR